MERLKEKIRVSSLSYTPAEEKVLDNVHLTVKEGQFVGIIGPNGSGKTSILKHIYRVLPVESGKIFLNGRDIASMSIRETAASMTVLRQEGQPEFDYTNLEMVLMGRMPHKKFYEGTGKRDLDIADKALEYVGMAKFKDRLFSTLSGGEKQRILMARSLTQEADIYILDEPTNHLDVYYQWHLMKLIKRLNKTVLAVFHDLSIALEYCDYLYVLNKGRIEAEGKGREVLQSDIIRNVFRVAGEVVRTGENKDRVVINDSIG